MRPYVGEETQPVSSLASVQVGQEPPIFAPGVEPGATVGSASGFGPSFASPPPAAPAPVAASAPPEPAHAAPPAPAAPFFEFAPAPDPAAGRPRFNPPPPTPPPSDPFAAAVVDPPNASRPNPSPAHAAPAASSADLGWLRAQMEALQAQIQSLAASLAHQQSVFVDIAGVRTNELHSSLAEVEKTTTALRAETQRLRQLQDAITEGLGEVVVETVRPELRAQLGQRLPQVVVDTLGPEVRRALADWLPGVVAEVVTPDVRQILADWMPVMVADTIQPEVRQAMAERLPDITAAAVQPEIGRVLSEMQGMFREELPRLVADGMALTVQPELRAALTEGLPGVVAETILPSVHQTIFELLPAIVTDSVAPEVRQTLEQQLPGIVAHVVAPELSRVLAEGLPRLVADTVQPEMAESLAELSQTINQTLATVGQTMSDLRDDAGQALAELSQYAAAELPQMVADAVQPELRGRLDERLPKIVADIVSPEVRRTLGERLPHMVAETVQPELRQMMADRIPAIIADVVGPQVAEQLSQRLPSLIGEAITPDLTVTLAEMEGTTAELRHEAAKLRALRDVVAERLPETVVAAVEPILGEALAIRFPVLLGQVVEPLLREVITGQLPNLVAEAVRPHVSQSLADRVPELVADTIRPELRAIVADAMSQRLPDVVYDAVRPELRTVLHESLPAVVAQTVGPEVVALVIARLPGMLTDTVTPDLSVTLAEVEGCAAEMRAETARLRNLREVVAERLPQAVMGAVQTVLDDTVVPRLPEMLGRLMDPVIRDAVAAPLAGAVGQAIDPAVREAMARQLPELLRDGLRREITTGLSESLPSLVADATEPELHAALAAIEAGAARLRAEAESMSLVRGELSERILGELAPLVKPAVQEGLAVPLPSAIGQLLGPALEAVLSRQLPGLIREAMHQEVQMGLGASLPGAVATATQGEVQATLAGLEASAARLRGEAESVGLLRQELRVEAESFARMRDEVTRQLPEMVSTAVSSALAGQASAIDQTRLETTLREAINAALAARGAPLAPEPDWGLENEPPVPEPPRSRPPRREPNPAEPLSRGPSPIEWATGSPSDWTPAQEPEAWRTAARPAPVPAATTPPPAPDEQVEGVEGAGAGAAGADEGAATSAPPPAAAAPEPPPAAAAAAWSQEPLPPVAAKPPAEPVDDAPARVLVPPASVTPEADGGEVPADSEAGVSCVLPGVVVGPSLARGISDAVTRARLRRRRRRRAGPPAAGLHRRDPFAGEVTRRLEWFALARRDASKAANGQADPGTVAAGERDGREVVLPLHQSGGLCLAGPRAREVARALVLTLLADNHPDKVRAIVVGDVLPSAPTFPGLGRVRDVGSVLGGLQTEATRRQEMFREAGVNDVDAFRGRRPDVVLPLIVVATAELTSAEAGRLQRLLTDGPRLGIAGLVVDATLEGLPSLRLGGTGRVSTVNPDNAADELLGARLFTLDRAPAAELLTVIASARTDLEGEGASEAAASAPFEPVPSTSASISVQLLGGYRIEVAGREIRSGLRAKARELLAFYLIHPEGAPLEEATEALWPEADPRRGSEWFWTALGNLRSRLRSATGNTDLKVIEREGDRYLVEPVFDVDLWRFESFLASASAGSGEATWADALKDAADGYGGELLAGADWVWSEVPREDLRGRAVDVLVSLAATRLVAGEVPAALEALQRAVEVDPLAEQLYRRIMRLQAKLSRRDEVQATYRTLQARLGEIDLEPTPESEKLLEELSV